MRLSMRLAATIAAFLVICGGVAYRQAHGQAVRTSVEFYVAGRGQAPRKYRVRRFRLMGERSPELAGQFDGLAAQGLEEGEYQYALEPEAPPPGPPGSLTLTGSVQLYGPLPHWITLQMPTGVVADTAPGWIGGRVLPIPGKGGDPFWVRFQDVVDHSQFFQVKVNADGAFRIPSTMFDGSVVVTVCRGDEVMLVNVIHFSGGRPDRPLEFRRKP